MLKPILWVCVVVGLAPVCLLAGYALFGLGVAAWVKRGFTGDRVIVYTAIPLRGVGVIEHVWPAVAVLIGSGAVVAGFAKMFSPMPGPPETKVGRVGDIPSLIAALSPRTDEELSANLTLSAGEFGPMIFLERESTADSHIIQLLGDRLTSGQFDATLNAIESQHGEIVDDLTFRSMRTVRVRFPSRESATGYAMAFFHDVTGLPDNAELDYFN